MDDDDEHLSQNEDYEPQIDSNNPEERKLARRLRIQRRLEAAKKAACPSESTVLAEHELRESAVQQQIDESAETVENLILEGDEFVTNVRAANDAREVARRDQEGCNKELIFEKLKEEADLAEEAFHEIADKWAGILKYNDPLHLDDDMMAQKEKCDELLRQKDGIIAMLKDELKKAVIDFNRNQVKQLEDISSLTQRIEKQINLMRKAYRQELDFIEEVILSERRIALESNDKNWEDLYGTRDEAEQQNYQDLEEAREKFLIDANNLRRECQESYRETKINLENTIGELQREFEKIKTTTMINNEKLDYNYQILKKREDENLIMKSQQKRRLNKLQDQINRLKHQIIDNGKDTKVKSQKLKNEIDSLQKNIMDTETKAKHFAKVNNEKFLKMWKMNKVRAEVLVNKIESIDKIIHEHHLGLEWKKADKPFRNIKGLPSYVTATKLISQLDDPDQKGEHETNSTDISQNIGDNYNSITKRILELIADKTQFLLESQLEVILEPYEKDQNQLVKLDNVFTALGLQNKADIDLMIGFFLPYTYCKICAVNPKQDNLLDALRELESIEGEVDENASVSSDTVNATILSETPLKIYETTKGECQGALDLIINSPSSHATLVQVKDKFFCYKNHPLLISSVYVLKALEAFMSKSQKRNASNFSTTNIEGPFDIRRPTICRLVHDKDIVAFWKNYKASFSPETRQLWDGLLEGLRKFHELLKERKQLSEEVISIRKQNHDLRKILVSYVNKKKKTKKRN